MSHFCLFGNHPDISETELFSVFGSKPAFRIGPLAVFHEKLDTKAASDILGGLVKAGDIIWEGNASDFNTDILADWIKKHHKKEKILFGLTVYAEHKKEAGRFKHLPIKLKKSLKPLGKKVRWVTGERGEIRPVTVQKLKMIDEGYDFAVILHKSKVHIGKTTGVQDANLWSDRDYGRPFRDAKTGMLPPKLARMMVNIAIGKKPKKHARLMDPFCGAGTILMEAAMRAPELALIGSDIDDKQVRGAERNIQWLIKRNFVDEKTRVEWMVSSAQDIGNKLESNVEYIVTEGFLGRPLQGHESANELLQNMSEVESIWEETLPILSKLQNKGGKLICIWPEYHARGNIMPLDMTKTAKDAGYKRLDKNNLLYGRENQHVMRKIVILEKK